MRKVISKKAIKIAFSDVEDLLKQRLTEKGPRGFVSAHEILGILSEEYTELILAVQSNEEMQVIKELRDIAVGAIFALACYRDGAIDGKL